MKKITKIILFALLLAASGIVSSCQKENVEPSIWKEGNVQSNDDWEKQNV